MILVSRSAELFYVHKGLLSNVPHWMLLSILSTLGLRFSLIVIYHLCMHGPMQNLAKTCSTPFLFGIPACIIQSRLFTSSKHYSLKSRWNVYYPLVTCLLGAHALLCPCENIHQNQTQVFGPKCIILNIRPNTTNAKRANSAMRLARKNFRIHMSQTVTC